MNYILDFIPKSIRHLRDWSDFVLLEVYNQFVQDTNEALEELEDNTLPGGGSEGQVLTILSGSPGWADAIGGGSGGEVGIDPKTIRYSIYRYGG